MFFRNSSCVPRTPLFVKSVMAKNSWKVVLHGSSREQDTPTLTLLRADEDEGNPRIGKTNL